MTKIKMGRIPYVYPVPIVLVGATVDGKANFAEVGDCAVAGVRPALVMVSLGEGHHTTRGILEHRTFSINVPNTKLLSSTDRCGIVSGRDVDKSRLFTVEYGGTGTAPLIAECPICLECRVLQQVQIEHRCVFVAEVVECFADEAFVTERDGTRRIAGLVELDPILYALDNRYYRVGSPIGTGYAEGRDPSIADCPGSCSMLD